MREMRTAASSGSARCPRNGHVAPSWPACEPDEGPQRGMIETNLLASVTARSRRDINATDGLLPASFETYNVIGPTTSFSDSLTCRTTRRA